MSNTTRRAGTALAATALITAGLVLGATTASAKSDLGIGTRSGAVAVGGTVRVHAAGGSDDFGGDPILLCVDQRGSKGRWHTLRCTSGYRLTVDVPATRPGVLAFRAQLVARTGTRHRVVDRTSRTLHVAVR
jgi:hypothetical protein